MLKTFRRQLLYVDRIRGLVAYIRYFYYAKLRRMLRTIDVEKMDPVTVRHNLRSVIPLMNSRRSNIFIRPLSVIERVHENSSILVIGPRTEGEMLLFVAFGFNPKTIRGLDLISYSPWIEIGDMHAMPYSDNSWDVVVSGMVLSYSNDPQQAAREMLRVVKHGGIIVIAVEYDSGELSREELMQRDGYVIESGMPERRIQTVHGLLQLFDGNVDTVFFQQDGYIAEHPNTIKGSPTSTVVVIFSVKK
ncbi:MAG: class I SAM-dependent methyltransferase [Bacteroidota bacterium]|nr:class I SAM-dependent methyltransferase [Candidatus Kapabacteria bacterium]MDW8219553.1 class I SAM-dependent methyltransferase [Bacteroidota bacterium]